MDTPLADPADAKQEENGFLARLSEAERTLSPKMRRVARLICDAPQEACFNPMRELARRAGVGQTTVLRLVDTLGFKGYPEFLDALRTDVLHNHQAYARFARASASQQKAGSPLDPFLNQELDNLRKLRDTLNQEQFRKAVKLIAGARTVILAGTRACRPLVLHAQTVLERIRVPVEAFTNLDPQFFYRMDRHVPGAAVIAFGFHRYTRAMLPFLDYARRSGLPAVMFTDSHTSPFQGDVVFAVPTRQTGFFANHCAPLVLLNALLLAVSAEDQACTENALRLFEENIKQNKLFISAEEIDI